VTATFLIIAVLLLALTLTFVGLVGWAHVLFPLRGERAQRLSVTCDDGWELSVWHRPALAKRYAEPVILCHGLGNNHRIFEFQPPLSLAVALSDAGFDCYAVDLRGCGDSSRPPKGRRAEASFDDHVLLDVPAVLKLVRSRANGAKAIWVGHSMGGLIALAASDEPTQEQLQGLITLGSPVFLSTLDARTRIALRLGLFFAVANRIHLNALARLAVPFAGLAPPSLMAGMISAPNVDAAIRRRALTHMIAPIWHGVLTQFADWIRNDVFRSRDGKVDYRERIARLHVPLLTIGGSADRLAPKDVIERAHALAGSSDKTLIIDSLEGQAYGHGDMLFGRDAPIHMYARIIAWLEKHATPERPEDQPASLPRVGTHG
jgi:pimeloyl-ACP methyl ester carboxylesterase